jgi:hypothetical protein
MSITAISNLSADRVAAVAAAPEVVRTASATDDPPSGGRRHELLDAMEAALGIQAGSMNADAEQAAYGFAHALMQDLRQMGDEGGDLPARVGTLAGLAFQSKAGAAPASKAPSSDDLKEPSPLTATTAALHVMQVPSSQLVEAYATLQRTLPEVDETAAGSIEPGQLAAFLHRLSEHLGAVPADAPGTLFDALA